MAYFADMQHSLLSTKKLTSSQEELVLNSGVSLTHFDVLDIHKINPIKGPTHSKIIISSSNAIPYLKDQPSENYQFYCVGSKTNQHLQELGLEVNHMAQNASDLAAYILANYPTSKFSYLCSPQRRDELPALLLKAKVPLEEIFVYESVARMKSFDRIFAAVTFYSPRGVIAFAKANPKKQPQYAVCIGTTTAATAKNYYDTVIVANKQTVENTLVTAIKALRK